MNNKNIISKALALIVSTRNPIAYIKWSLRYHKGLTLRQVIEHEYESMLHVREMMSINGLY